MNNSLLSEASESELLETYTKTVTKTNALQVSLMKEEEIIRQLLNEANMAEKRHYQLEEAKIKLKEKGKKFQRDVCEIIKKIDEAIEMDISVVIKND